MRILKKINNNFALAEDSRGNMMIASGKGIGFGKMPYELNDLSKIDRTFYSINEHYLILLNEIDEQIWSLSAHILDKARRCLPYAVDESLYFVLADHLNFAIQRAKEQVYLRTGLLHDIQAYYPGEMELGMYAVELINKTFHVKMLKDEAANIAMHIVESEDRSNKDNHVVSASVIEDITQIIEKSFAMNIDRSSFNYSRLVSHIQYLLLRAQNKVIVVSDNKKLFESMKNDYPKTYACVEKIKEYLVNNKHLDVSNEEMLYLMLHVNRLCYREESK